MYPYVALCLLGHSAFPLAVFLLQHSIQDLLLAFAVTLAHRVLHLRSRRFAAKIEEAIGITTRAASGVELEITKSRVKTMIVMGWYATT